MKVCLYGAGAVGGFLGAQLGRTGCQLSVVEVGATLDALRSHGLRVHTKTEFLQQPVHATDDPRQVGVQDLVVIAVKGPTLIHVARNIAPLTGPNTVVMPAMNGVPWWFFDGFGGQYAGIKLESIDPVGAIAAAIPVNRVVGCVVHGSFSCSEPGVVRQGMGCRLTLGEPDGSESSRVRELAALFAKSGGIEVSISSNIRAAIWFKLWGNVTMNPVSAITGATGDRILDDPLVYQFVVKVMDEAKRIGGKIGCPINETPDERNAIIRKLDAFKTSMLQDVEAGKSLELDSLVAVVREIGQKVGEPTPYLDTLLGLARLYAQVHGLYPAPPRSVGAGA